jgi:GntR family transcriptional regulator, transcriptional repressor for pyruvate dehydrogenase complex
MTKRLTYEIVYEEIKSRIKQGTWKSGDQIPTVFMLAEEMGVGVSSVREAIRVLAKQKILSVEQGRGTFVAKDLESRVSPSERVDFLEKATMLQLTEARLIIEPELAYLAAENASDEEITMIQKAANGMNEKVSKNKDFFDEDMEFHFLIAKVSRNEVLMHMINAIKDLLVDSRRKTMKIKEVNKRSAHFHVLIADAIAQKNPTQARTLMKTHIEDVLFELKKDETNVHLLS